jgi:hypothetical protein
MIQSTMMQQTMVQQTMVQQTMTQTRRRVHDRQSCRYPPRLLRSFGERANYDLS